MLKRFAPLAIAGIVGFLLASLLNGGTPASAVSTTSDQVKLINYTTCLQFTTSGGTTTDDLSMWPRHIKLCTPFLK